MDEVTQQHMDIIASYGRALEGDESPVRDVRELPFPKERIKEALRYALVNFNSLYADQSLLPLLLGGYMALADFQDFGGNPPGVLVVDMEDDEVSDGQPLEESDDLLNGTEDLRQALELVERERAQLETELIEIEAESRAQPQPEKSILRNTNN